MNTAGSANNQYRARTHIATIAGSGDAGKIEWTDVTTLLTIYSTSFLDHSIS